ncbi:MAG: NYN domain-containing protein [Bacteroidetes bacterium]|nr:NYN domain-containing protein [Bacteroidota bacterium]MCL5026090.1 NYN domain-containing protein [Chloroflexota bacterium]
MRPPLIIDGYNVLHENPQLAQLSRRSMEEGREMLVSYLSAKAGRYDITVVFDGWQHGGPAETAERVRGVRVVYSKLGERADEVIKRLIDRAPPQAIVVSNDIEIRTYAERAGCQVARPDQLTRIASERPVQENDRRVSSEKRGPAQRPKRRRSPPPWRF